VNIFAGRSAPRRRKQKNPLRLPPTLGLTWLLPIKMVYWHCILWIAFSVVFYLSSAWRDTVLRSWSTFSSMQKTPLSSQRLAVMFWKSCNCWYCSCRRVCYCRSVLLSACCSFDCDVISCAVSVWCLDKQRFLCALVRGVWTNNTILMFSYIIFVWSTHVY